MAVASQSVGGDDAERRLVDLSEHVRRVAGAELARIMGLSPFKDSPVVSPRSTTAIHSHSSPRIKRGGWGSVPQGQEPRTRLSCGVAALDHSHPSSGTGTLQFRSAAAREVFGHHGRRLVKALARAISSLTISGGGKGLWPDGAEEGWAAGTRGGGVGAGVAESGGSAAEIFVSSSPIACGGRMPTSCCTAPTGISACQLATAAHRLASKPERAIPCRSQGSKM